MIVYVGKDYRCHADPGEGLEAVADAFFDGKCDTFIEGYCYDTSKGYTQIYPWKNSAELEAAQAQYEKDSAVLMAEYQRGVNSAYD